MAGNENVQQFLKLLNASLFVYDGCVMSGGGFFTGLCGKYHVKKSLRSFSIYKINKVVPQSNGKAQDPVLEVEYTRVEELVPSKNNTAIQASLSALPTDIVESIIGHVSNMPSEQLRIQSLAMSCKALNEMLKGKVTKVTKEFFITTLASFLSAFSGRHDRSENVAFGIGDEDDEDSSTGNYKPWMFVNIEFYEKINETKLRGFVKARAALASSIESTNSNVPSSADSLNNLGRASFTSSMYSCDTYYDHFERHANLQGMDFDGNNVKKHFSDDDNNMNVEIATFIYTQMLKNKAFKFTFLDTSTRIHWSKLFKLFEQKLDIKDKLRKYENKYNELVTLRMQLNLLKYFVTWDTDITNNNTTIIHALRYFEAKTHMTKSFDTYYPDHSESSKIAADIRNGLKTPDSLKTKLGRLQDENKYVNDLFFKFKHDYQIVGDITNHVSKVEIALHNLQKQVGDLDVDIQELIVANIGEKCGGHSTTNKKKVKVLGRVRNVTIKSRCQHVMYKKQLIRLSDARKLEKQLKK